MTPQTKSSSWAVLCLSVVQTPLCKAFGIFRVQQVGRSDLKWSDFETLRALQQTRPQFASFDKVADFFKRSCLYFHFYIMGKTSRSCLFLKFPQRFQPIHQKSHTNNKQFGQFYLLCYSTFKWANTSRLPCYAFYIFIQIS